MRVLVTGATGYVGLNLVHSLVADHDVVALVRPGTTTDRLPGAVETVEGDVTDPDSLPPALAGVEGLVHLAAAVPPSEEMMAVNVDGTRALLDAADEAGVERVVFASTIGAHPDVPTDPSSQYQFSKVRAENLFLEGDRSFAFSILYPTYILGPRDYRLARYELFRRVDANRVLVPPLYTYDEYNLVHVDDVVDSVAYCLTRDADRRYVVSGPNLTNMEVLRTVADVVGGTCRVVDVPYRLTKYVVVPALDALHRRGVSPVGGSGFLERSDYGTLRPELTERAPVDQRSWRSALADTADWYREVGLL